MSIRSLPKHRGVTSALRDHEAAPLAGNGGNCVIECITSATGSLPNGLVGLAWANTPPLADGCELNMMSRSLRGAARTSPQRSSTIFRFAGGDRAWLYIFVCESRDEVRMAGLEC